MKKLKLLDLFSGIGGFSLGLESTGFFETIAFVEKDKFCQKVLRKNFNNIPIEEDIRNVKGSKYKADVITGGFPCQPFSIAGKRKGTDDDRYLWDETIRVVRECKSKWFIGENVEGIINIQEGLVLRQVQDDLEKEGFQVQCLIIPASGIGAFHHRKRIWIIGCNVSNSNNNGSHRQERNETKQSCNEQKNRVSFGNDKDVPNSNSDPKTNRGKYEIDEEKSIRGECIKGRRKTNGGERCISGTWETSNVPNSLSSLRRGGGAEFKSGADKIWEFYSKEKKQSEHNIWSKTIGCDVVSGKTTVQHTNSKRFQKSNISSKPTKKDGFFSEGYNGNRKNKTWWETQSKLCGVPNGISYELDKDRASRIKSLGNSIVPQIARQLGLAIMEAEND